MVKRGLTWKSAIITPVVIVALLAGFFALQDSLARTYELDVSVTGHEIVPTGSGCEWQFQIRVFNPNERRVSLVAFELDNIDDSARGTLAQVGVSESVERVYRLPLDDCAVGVADREPGQLKTTFKLVYSSTERSVKDLID